MTMKLTDPTTGREAIIDGVIKDANGGAVDATTAHAVYVDKEGVRWNIEVERNLTSADEWSGSMADMTQSVYAKDPRGMDPIAVIFKNSLLDVVEAIDANGFKWRSAQRKADKASDGNKWGWLFVLGLAWLASKKGKR